MQHLQKPRGGGAAMEFLKQNLNCMEIPTESWQPSSLQAAQRASAISGRALTSSSLSTDDWALTVRSVERRNRAHSSIPQIEELSHLAELLVARSEQFPDRLIRQRRQLPVQHFIQESRRPFMIGVRAAFRLRHDFVNDSQLFQIFRRDL